MMNKNTIRSILKESLEATRICDIGREKRCSECIRPICQRKLIPPHKWEQDISLPLINPYEMHDLFSG